MQDTESSSIEDCPSCGTPVDASEVEPLSRVPCPVCGAELIVNRYISHYELLEEVGRGGMGVVYKALDTSLGRNVALKILRKDHSDNPELIRQLETEAAITASINHPHVVRVFSTGTFEGRFYIAMELVDKGTLDDLIELQGSVAEAQVLDVAIQIAQGLRAAYQHGLIHRDVKPGNILFADAQTAKIVDFGLATIEQAVASSGEIWGTPYYVAPEKLDKKPEDFRSDMYSLGATLFHALAGRPPFEAADATLVALKHLKSEAVSLQAFAPHVTGSTAYVINRTLLKDPDRRYQSYDELIDHLEYARREFVEQVSKPKTKQRLVMETEHEQKLWSYVTFAMLGLLILVGAGAWWFMQKAPKSSVKPPDDDTTIVAKATPPSAQGRTYEAARAVLVRGDFDEAAKRFHSLATDEKTPEPLRHWSYVHEGLAHLFAGKLTEARSAFDALRDLGAPGGKDAQLAKFFGSLADKARSAEVGPAPALTEFDGATTRPLAMLVLGMKAWELAEFDQAATLIRGFNSAQPAKEFAWISEYKPLVSNYVADLTEYRGAMEMAKGAKDAASTKAALDVLTRTRAGLANQRKLGPKIDSAIQELRKKESDAAAEKTRSVANEKGNFDKAVAVANDLANRWQFDAARKGLAETELTSPVLVGKRDLLSRKLAWLADAKNALIAAVPKAGRSVPLRLKTGSPFAGAVSKATEDSLEITGGGKIPWQDIAPAGLVAVLGLPQVAGAATAGDHQWSAAVLAVWSGEEELAPKYLVASARGRRQYLDALSAVWPGLRITDENFALRKSAQAAHSTSPAESADKAVDGDPATFWASDRAGAKVLQLDLGAPRIITRWVLKHARYAGEKVEANAASYSLQASPDGKAWTEVDAVKSNTADATNRTILPARARFFRLNVLEPAAAKIPELELYGGTMETGSKVSFLDPNSSPIVPSFDTLGIDLQEPQQLGATTFKPATGEWAMRVAGRDIWDKADSFVYLYQPMNGDGEIVLHAASIEAVDPYTKLGVMMRETLTPGSRYAMTCMSALKGFAFQERKQTDDVSLSTKHEVPLPGWVKVVRSGNTFSSFISTEGTKWQPLGEPSKMDMPQEIFVGVAATSHNIGKKASFTFSNAAISQQKRN